MAASATLFGMLAFLALTPVLFAQEALEDTAENELISSDANGKFSITPVVANDKAKPRDIIKKELMLTNHTNRRIDLYLTVENIDPTGGAQEFVSPAASDLARSLANWIEITRGVIELGPQESRKIPYLIHVNLTALPGSYFARIAVTEGARRPEAEWQEIGAELILNLEVLDDAKERLTLGGFTADDTIILGEEIGFSYNVENVGNRLLEPRGSIRIFNRRGEEVGSVPLNADGVEINPENKRQLATAWNASGRFGKYKAFLDLEYGENQLASVQDTLYFWVFPWKEILATFVGIIVLAVIGTFIVHMRAIARPAPAYVGGPAPEPTPGVHVSGPPLTTSGRARQTVLVERPSRQTPDVGRAASSVSRTQKEGSTVSLAPRGSNTTVTKHGATIELTSRTGRVRR